jgi:hypothetical protein
MGYPSYPENTPYDDDSKDIRALLENTQAWLSFVEHEELSTTDKLLVASININVALTIALGRMTGVLKPQTTNIQSPNSKATPLLYQTWCANSGISDHDMRQTLNQATTSVPDWRNFKIKFIKEIRAITGVGLKEAKDLADLASAEGPNEWWR